MTYATQADIEELYGADALYVADRDGDGTAEAGAVTRAIEEAAAEIDSHIGARYTLPLAQTPPILRRICVDIAIYRLALSHDALSEEMRVRYDDAVKHLVRLAKGDASLNLPADPDAGDDFGAPQPIVSSGPERLFSRDKTRGL